MQGERSVTPTITPTMAPYAWAATPAAILRLLSMRRNQGGALDSHVLDPNAGLMRARRRKRSSAARAGSFMITVARGANFGCLERWALEQRMMQIVDNAS